MATAPQGLGVSPPLLPPPLRIVQSPKWSVLRECVLCQRQELLLLRVYSTPFFWALPLFPTGTNCSINAVVGRRPASSLLALHVADTSKPAYTFLMLVHEMQRSDGFCVRSVMEVQGRRHSFAPSVFALILLYILASSATCFPCAPVVHWESNPTNVFFFLVLPRFCRFRSPPEQACFAPRRTQEDEPGCLRTPQPVPLIAERRSDHTRS